MASFVDQSYSLVHQDNAADQPSTQELKTQLEKGSDETKIDTMKRILTIMLNGDPQPQLLMHIIRFVMPSKNKPLKKLLYLYYEICPKHDASGKLKQEMILVWFVLITLLCAIDTKTDPEQQRHPYGLATRQRVHQGQHTAIPVQTSRCRADRAPAITCTSLSRAQTLLCSQECRLCNCLHLSTSRKHDARRPRALVLFPRVRE